MSLHSFKLIAFFSLTLVSCTSTLSSEQTFDFVRIESAKHIGFSSVWAQDKESEQQVQERVQALLTSPFSAESAAEIAVLNSPQLQAAYENIGIARAELLRAGLLSNPLLEIRPRFPSIGSGTNLELGISHSIFDVFFIPLKQRIASDQIEIVKAKVAAEILKTATRAKTAFYELQAALQEELAKKQVLASFEAGFVTAQALHHAGNISALELANQQALYEQTKIDALNSAAEVQAKQDNINLLLRLGEHADLMIVEPQLPWPIEENLQSEILENYASQNEFELQSMRLEILSNEKSLGLQNSELLQNGEIGISAEKDPDGSWVTGPNLLLPLPIFDQGQATKQTQMARLKQSRVLFQAQVAEKRLEIRSAVRKIENSRRKIELYRNNILPLRQNLTAETQTHYNAMQLGIYDLLLAKQNEIQASSDFVGALREYWLLRTQLEALVGANLKSIMVNSDEQKQ